MTLSEYMIVAADVLRKGGSEFILAIAMQNDGIPVNRIDTMLRWCKIYNESLLSEQVMEHGR
jgi:hypothetical protein